MQASNRPPSASASLAATKAFIRDRESNGALSSAAAAAALRTHTTTPTPVGETVTKRMVRKASVSSQGSASQTHPGLRRQSSSGSMTERSFRAPSPSRSSPIDPNAPPVPAVPKNVPQVSVVHRRNSSLEPPARGGSPAGRGAGRGVSLDRGSSSPAHHGRGQSRTTTLSKVVEDEQTQAQRSSINFSRPISPPAAPSPTPAPTRGKQSGWFGGPVVNPEQSFRGAKPRPKTSDGVQAYATQQAVQNAADRPVSTRTAHLSSGVEGARLATGTMRAKPSGTNVPVHPTHTAARDRPVRIVDPNSPYAVYDPSSRKFIHKQDAMNLHRAMSDAEEPPPQYQPQPVVSKPRQEAPRYSQSAAPQHRNIVQRSPSVSPVREPQQPVPFTSYASENEAIDHPTTHAAVSREQPVAFKTQEFAEAEDRLPADANTSRKLESSNRENVERTQDVTSPKFASNQESSYPLLAPTGHGSSGPPSTMGSERSARTQSISPPRNAHFAAVAVEFPNGVKHQPPGRSVSPAKSALKPSPSVSRRSHSPIANDGRMVDREASSEVGSDALLSESGGKKKKKVRISFEEEPIVVGTSAYSDIDASNEFGGSSASRWDNEDDEEGDDFMKPRPMLPSFGSIRDKNRRPRDDDAAEKVTETVSSSLSNSATLMGESQEVSSDHKIGGILAQDFASKSTSSDPLPPEVTSVEGSGYWSDSEKSDEVNTGPIAHDSGSSNQGPSQSTPSPEPKTLTNQMESRTAPLQAPTIAVLPATPPIPQQPEVQPLVFTQPASTPAPAPEPALKSPRPFIPGGWGDDDGSEPEDEIKRTVPAVTAPTSPSITIQIPDRPIDDSSSDDNSSVYSDAYEDIEDGEGFGSIDAIMESPIQPPTSRFASTNSSPSEQRTHKTGLEASRWAPTIADDVFTSSEQPTQKPGLEASRWAPNKADMPKDALQKQGATPTNDDWEKSQQHWRELHASRGQQPQQVQAPAPTVQTKAQPKRNQAESSKERRVKVEPAVVQVQQPSQPAKAPAQPRKSAMKKTTPAPQPAEIPLKKTMRDRAPMATAPEPTMRTTMRGSSGGFTSRGAAAQRQSMPPLDTRPPKGALQKKHLPAATSPRSRPQSASGVPAQTRPVYQAPAYESDSDVSVSSFQRERQRNRASRPNNGAYTMRASMRSGPAPSMRAAPPVRSISPPRSAVSPPPSTLRKSMRPSSPVAESPSGVKSSRFSIRSLSPAGRFKRRSTYEAPPPPMPAPVQAPLPKKMPMFGKATNSKPAIKAPKPFKSRINDSSDEEDDRPRRFQSRFADSDSEDEDFELPPGLTPVRGIPKRPGEEDGDSTDLEEEASDNEPSPPPVTNGNSKSQTTNGLANPQGANLATGSIRKPELPSFDGGKKKNKRGFFGFGKKKNSYLSDSEADSQKMPSLDIPMPPTQANRDQNRPLTPIGEDHDIDRREATTNPPKAGRRTPLERSASDSWPLPSPQPAFAEDQRPQSADGPVRKNSHRPTLVKRNPSQMSQTKTEIDPKSGKEVSFSRSGKKKKFQGLRRVFGLND